MKVYVCRDPRTGELRSREHSLSLVPVLTMRRPRAEFLAYWLNAGATGSEDHRCDFQLEEVEPARFALVCADHPELD
jgi:hypothetical protein